MAFNQEQHYTACVRFNEKAIIIQTMSGNGMMAIDHMYQPFILPLDVDDIALSNALLQALSNSRTFTQGSDESIDFFDLTKGEDRYENWVSHLCQSLGYKTKKSLLKNMMLCDVYLFDSVINIYPNRHVRLDAWDGLGKDKAVTLSLDSTPDEIGKGLRLAMSYCL